MQNSRQNKAESEDSLENSLKKANYCLVEVINKHVKRHQNPAKVPKVDSVCKKLLQFLEENNKEEVVNLLIASKNVAEAVTERLDSKYILPILDILLSKLEENPRTGIDLNDWFQSIFHYHCEYMKTVPELRSKLSFLHKLLDTRAAAYMKLQKLSGRINLMKNITSSLNHDDNEFIDSSNEKTLKELSEALFDSSESEIN